MIESLYNPTFLVFAILVYLAVIIYAARLFGLFKYITDLRQTKEILLKITSNSFVKKAVSLNSDKIKPVLLFSVNNIFQPAIKVTGRLLHKFSQYLINISGNAEVYISENCKEGFELVCVFSRRIVYAESGSLWTAFLAILVLFYFILTNL